MKELTILCQHPDHLFVDFISQLWRAGYHTVCPVSSTLPRCRSLPIIFTLKGYLFGSLGTGGVGSVCGGVLRV
jgi:hypothetical protein